MSSQLGIIVLPDDDTEQGDGIWLELERDALRRRLARRNASFRSLNIYACTLEGGVGRIVVIPDVDSPDEDWIHDQVHVFYSEDPLVFPVTITWVQAS